MKRWCAGSVGVRGLVDADFQVVLRAPPLLEVAVDLRGKIEGPCRT